MGFWETYRLVWKAIIVVAVLIGAIVGLFYGVTWVLQVLGEWAISLPAPWTDVVCILVLLLIGSFMLSFIIWIGEM